MRRTLTGLLFLAVAGLAAASPDLLQVGLYEKPPYVVRATDGSWDGLSVQLWEKTAARMGRSFRYVEMPRAQLVAAAEAGQVDVVLGELSPDPLLEQRLEFTTPFLASAFGAVALPVRLGQEWSAVRNALFSLGFFQVVAFIAVLVLLASFLFWILERRHDSGHFGGGLLRGFGSAIWFSVVTMTSVGYGDRIPSTLPGRSLAILWMFLGLVLVASFTGAVASAVTTARMETDISSIHDLGNVRVGVASDAAASLLQADGIHARDFASIEEGLAALRAGALDVFFADRLTLAWISTRDASREIRLLPLHAAPFSVAFGLPPGSPLRKPLNLAILETLGTSDWQASLSYWLGAQEARAHGLTSLPR
jgi:ABC-type amino acid transport substrate-binding protein